MKKLKKFAYDSIKRMIEEKEPISSILAACTGYGIDTKKKASPVTIDSNKISIEYRRKYEYHYYTHIEITNETMYYSKPTGA